MARKRYVSRARDFELEQELEQNLRAFLDPHWLKIAWNASPKAVVSCIEAWFKHGGNLVVTESAVDMELFQEDRKYLEFLLDRDELIPEFEEEPERLSDRLFYWASNDRISAPSATLEFAVRDFPNKDGILGVKDVITKYGIPKEQWKKGRATNKKDPLNDTMKEQLSLPSDATRSEVMIACKDKNKPGMHETYNSGHIMRLSELHNCLYVFYANCSIGHRV